MGEVMESQKQDKSINHLEHRLVVELESMRDALTNLSLVMHDLEFMLDVPQRQKALKLTLEGLRAINHAGLD